MAHLAGIEKVLHVLAEEDISLPHLIFQLLSSPRYERHPAAVSIILNAEHIANSLSVHPSSGARILDWAASICTRACQQEITQLTQLMHGLHFNAKHAKIEPLENFNLENLAGKMQDVTPTVWRLVVSLLQSDPNLQKRRESYWNKSQEVHSNGDLPEELDEIFEDAEIDDSDIELRDLETDRGDLDNADNELDQNEIEGERRKKKLRGADYHAALIRTVRQLSAL